LHTFDDILRAYQRQVQLPWQSDLPPAGRVWIVWYDKSMQRRFKARLGEFEHATILAGHGWRQLDLAPSFGQWIVAHELFAPLLMQPRELRGLLPEYEDAPERNPSDQKRTCTSEKWNSSSARRIGSAWCSWKTFAVSALDTPWAARNRGLMVAQARHAVASLGTSTSGAIPRPTATPTSASCSGVKEAPQGGLTAELLISFSPGTPSRGAK
jgi:hypothetical protein